jgi:hypothetical protein
VVGVSVLGLLLVWRLTEGPVDLDFLRGYVSRSFDTPEGPVRLDAKHVRIEWSGWEQPLRLTLVDIEAKDTKGVVVGSVPEVAINVSFNALIGGALAPTEIVIDRVALNAVIRKDGLIDLMLPPPEAAPSARMLPIIVEQLLREPNTDHPLGRLAEVRINSAKLRVDDQTTGFVWDAPAGRATLQRDYDGLRIKGALTVESKGHVAEMELIAFYGRKREVMEVTLRARDLRLSAFATAAPQLAPLAQIDLPMTGHIRLFASGAGKVQRVALDFEGGSGMIGVPGVLPEPRRVDWATLRMSFDTNQSAVRLEDFRFGLGGAELAMQGVMRIEERAFQFDGEAKLESVPVDRLAEFWLPSMAPGGRRWTLANISGGRLDSAKLTVSASGDFQNPDDLKVAKTIAELRYSDLTVNYLSPLPPVKGVSGTAQFDGSTFRFNIDGGQAGAIKVGKSRVDLTGLDGDDHRTDMLIELQASAQETMNFLTHPKLGLPKDMLYNPKRLGGDVAISLSLKFALLDALSVNDIVYGANAKFDRFSLTNAVGTLNLTDFTGALQLDTQQLKVAGRGKADGQSVDLSWTELFGAKPVFRRRYEAKGTLPLASLYKAGLPDLATYASGATGFDLSYQTPVAGPSELRARLDLRDAALTIKEASWTKAAGVEGRATVSARFAGGPVPPVLDFDLAAADLQAAGKLESRPTDGRIERLTLGKLVLGATNVAGTVRRVEGGYAVDLAGAAIELKRVLPDTDPNARGVPKPASPKGPLVSINLDVGAVLLKRGALPRVKGSLALRGDRLISANLQTTPDGAATAQLRVTPAGNGRSIEFEAPDFGAVLRSAGWLDGLVGGHLRVSATTDDAKPEPPARGRIELKTYRLQKVPVNPARSVASLNGVVDQLSRVGGDRQVFDALTVDVEKDGDRLRLRNGRTSGNNVGVTVQGTVQLNTDEVCLAGGIVPAYALNSIISNIPLIGDLLTGGRGGGLFALNYYIRGPIDDPNTSVNPLSVLPIGPLRNLMLAGCGTASGDIAPPTDLSERNEQQRSTSQ